MVRIATSVSGAVALSSAHLDPIPPWPNTNLLEGTYRPTSERRTGDTTAMYRMQQSSTQVGQHEQRVAALVQYFQRQGWLSMLSCDGTPSEAGQRCPVAT